MPTLLGNIALSDHLLLRGLLSWTRVQLDAKRTIDGVYLAEPSAPMQGGRTLTLDGSGGYFTVGQLKAILALQAQGQPVVLQHDQGSFTVWITGITSPEMYFWELSDFDNADEVSAQIELTETA